jgi:hypothetical protein
VSDPSGAPRELGSDQEPVRYVDHRRLSWFLDVPWGVVILAVVVVLVAINEISGEEARALATAAGLLGIGHGIHTGAKNLRR